MLGYLIAVCWFVSAVAFLVQLRRPHAKKTKVLLLISGIAMLAMTVVQIDATRQHGSVNVELANIKVELDRMVQEGRSGHRFSAQELQDREDRLEKLQARLNALRR
jgi:hypothetical protein